MEKMKQISQATWIFPSVFDHPVPKKWGECLSLSLSLSKKRAALQTQRYWKQRTSCAPLTYVCCFDYKDDRDWHYKGVAGPFLETGHFCSCVDHATCRWEIPCQKVQLCVSWRWGGWQLTQSTRKLPGSSALGHLEPHQSIQHSALHCTPLNITLHHSTTLYSTIHHCMSLYITEHRSSSLYKFTHHCKLNRLTSKVYSVSVQCPVYVFPEYWTIFRTF